MGGGFLYLGIYAGFWPYLWKVWSFSWFLALSGEGFWFLALSGACFWFLALNGECFWVLALNGEFLVVSGVKWGVSVGFWPYLGNFCWFLGEFDQITLLI